MTENERKKLQEFRERCMVLDGSPALTPQEMSLMFELVAKEAEERKSKENSNGA